MRTVGLTLAIVGIAAIESTGTAFLLAAGAMLAGMTIVGVAKR
jgi:uncharacterized protein (DUF58 family)